MPLFRAEALEHRQQAWLGQIVLARPMSFTFLTTFAVVVAAAILAYLALGEYTRKARVAGFLAPREGLIKVVGEPGGTVLARFVKEGELVNRGDALFSVTYERRSAAAKETRAAVSRELETRRESLVEDLARQRTLQRQQEEALSQRIEALRSELAHLKAEIGTQERRQQIAAQTRDRFRELRAKGFVSEMQAQQKTDEYLDQQSKSQALERTRIGLARELASAEADLRDLPIKAQQDAASVQRNIASVGQDLAENEARREIVITAPESGLVTAILAEPGQPITAGVPLLAIVPRGSPLEAELFAPTSSIGFVKPGQKVLLRYAAYPYQKFGHHAGVVTTVARTALQPGELPAQVQAREPLYRITVALERQNVLAYGREEPLQAGMQLEADIEIDRRRLIEWVFEPLISLRGRL